MNSMSENTSDISTTPEPAWRIVSGTAAFISGIFICGSVGSFNPADPSWNTATQTEITNLFGQSGAIFADLARQLLGLSAWLGGFLLVIAGIRRLISTGVSDRRKWLLGLCIVPLAAACLASWPVPAPWPLNVSLGGMFGDALFYIATIPLKALSIPKPELIAGLLLGLAALYVSFAASGLDRRTLARFYTAAPPQPASSAPRSPGRKLQFRPQFLVKAQSWFENLKESAQSLVAERSEKIKEGRFDNIHVDDVEEVAKADATTQTAPPVAKDVISPAPKRARKKAGRKIANKLPPISLLNKPPERRTQIDEDALIARANRLAEVLREFGVRGRIKEVRPGPVVTLFELEPAPGVRSARVISLADDIARSMSSISARIAGIPGKNAIGIELPNDERQTVYLRSLLDSPVYSKSSATLPMMLGEDIGGTPIVAELSKMPHLLIAGTTGSGKSVGVNAMILSLIYRLPPQECRFIFIDPKMLELSIYEGIPHLLSPVVTDPRKAILALQWAVREMESRYELMSKAGVRNLAGFNAKAAEYRAESKSLSRKIQVGFDERGKPNYETEILPTDHIPNLVIVIDEMADLMLVAGKEIESCVQRLAQMARAAGIHLITATQRPSVDVITGTIKANFPTRISYMVTTKIDSRTILGEQGAEQLLGMGDLLYQAAGMKSTRCHGPFVSDEEVQSVVDWLRSHGGEPDYDPSILEENEEGSGSPIMDAMLGTSTGDKDEDLYAQAMAVVLRDNRASTSYVQRRLKVGYNKAATLIERLEDEGIISAPNHAGKRVILKQTDTPED
ncbi:MAG: cell division protein FtsK [Hyphomonadaceae bacterium]|nr:cell division protein FtsK [Hyphomonadaceae bacterium]